MIPKLCAVSIACVFWAVATSGPQDEEETGKNPKVTLTICSCEKTYLTTDLIPLDTTLSNNSGDDVTFEVHPSLGSGLSIQLAPPGKEYLKAVSFIMAGSGVANEGFPLKSGKRARAKCIVSLGFKSHDKFELPQPGEWRIRAAFTDGKMEITSAPLILSIRPPDALPANVVELFGGKAWHYFALNQGSAVNPEDVKPFIDFVESGQDAPQRDLMCLMVGRYWQKGVNIQGVAEARNPVTGEVMGFGKYVKRVPDHRKAISAYRQASRSKRTHVKEQALLRLAQCHRDVGERPDARDCLKDLNLDDADDDLKEEAEEVAESLKDENR